MPRAGRQPSPPEKRYKAGNVGAGATVLQGEHLVNITLQVGNPTEAAAVLDRIQAARKPSYHGPLLRRLDPIVLVNRTAPLQAIASFFADPGASVLIVHGMAGIGKSTLVRGAIALRQTPAVWLACDGLDPEQLLHGLCSGLGLDPQLLADSLANPTQALTALLAVAAAGILVLDGLEDILDDRGRPVRDGMAEILEGFSTLEHKLRVLVTTQQIPADSVDGVGGTRLLRLQGLDPAMALDLLVRRAPKTAGVTAATVPDRLMSSLNGHPKFIELVAGGLDDLAIEEVATGLFEATDVKSYVTDHVFAKLGDGERDVLRAAVVFRGVFSLKALEAVHAACETRRDLRRDVRALVRRAVLDRAVADQGYFLHAILRDAVDRTPVQESAAHRAAADWLALTPLVAADAASWSERLFHLRRGAELGDAAALDGFSAFLMEHAHELEFAGWGRRLETDLQALVSLLQNPGDRAMASFQLGIQLWLNDDHDQAIAVLEPLVDAVGPATASALLIKAKLGDALLKRERIAEASRIADEIAPLAESSEGPHYRLRYEELRFAIARKTGDRAAMATWAGKALASAQAWCEQDPTAQTKNALSEAHFAMAICHLYGGEAEAMVFHFLEQLKLKLEIGRKRGIASGCFNVGSILQIHEPVLGGAFLLLASQITFETDNGVPPAFAGGAAKAAPRFVDPSTHAAGRAAIAQISPTLTPVFDRALARLVPSV